MRLSLYTSLILQNCMGGVILASNNYLQPIIYPCKPYVNTYINNEISKYQIVHLRGNILLRYIVAPESLRCKLLHFKTSSRRLHLILSTVTYKGIWETSYTFEFYSE
jgi:hypothetical protein